jgi:molybdenum cofactor synthesis domain-containing protein
MAFFQAAVPIKVARCKNEIQIVLLAHQVVSIRVTDASFKITRDKEMNVTVLSRVQRRAMPQEEVTGSLLVIGDEILSGRTKDKNIGFVADHCSQIGIRLKEVRIVADEEAAIIVAVNELRRAYTYVFTTGGIGPTHDDITADAVARAFGVQIDIDPRAVAMLRERYAEADLTPVRLRMARIPAGAELIENSVSKAPGFMIGNVIVMAGVPAIMEAMLRAVTPRLKTGPKMLSDSIRINAPEGQIAALLAECQRIFPDVAMGSYPFFENGRHGTNLVLRSTEEGRITLAKADLMRRLGQNFTVSE